MSHSSKREECHEKLFEYGVLCSYYISFRDFYLIEFTVNPAQIFRDSIQPCSHFSLSVDSVPGRGGDRELFRFDREAFFKKGGEEAQKGTYGT